MELEKVLEVCNYNEICVDKCIYFDHEHYRCIFDTGLPFEWDMKEIKRRYDKYGKEEN